MRPHQTTSQPSQPTYAGLSPARRRLVAAMQRHPYSRIERLVVRDCEPHYGPATRWVAETKLGASNPARPECGLADFALKREHTGLFEQFDAIGTGEILALEIRAGLPFRVIRQVSV